MQDILGNAKSQSGGKVSWRTKVGEREVEEGDLNMAVGEK